MVGFFMPWVQFEIHVEVDKPVNQTFAVFNDVLRMKDWLHNFKSIETLSGKPNEIGSKYKLVVNDDGKDFEMTEVMTGFRENEYFAFRLENEVLTNDVETRFTWEGQKTEIVTKNKIIGKNIFWKSLFPFFKSTFREHTEGDFIRLKELVEKEK